MALSFIERQLESTVQGLLGNTAMRVMRGVSHIAAKQGGATMAENYQLLGKRVLAVAGVAIVAVQIVGYVIARKSEEQRIERVVRRVMAEERLKTQMEAKPEAEEASN